MGLKPLSRSGPLEDWSTVSGVSRPLPGSAGHGWARAASHRDCVSPTARTPPLATSEAGLARSAGRTESAGQRTAASVSWGKAEFFFLFSQVEKREGFVS